MKMNRKTLGVIGAAFAVTLALTGCEDAADVASRNTSTAADNFEVQRKIVGVNGITDAYAFEVEGRCSINDQGGQLEVMCKHGDDDFRKHFIGKSDNLFYVVTQLEPIKVSEYHTRIILKPQQLVPNLDLQTSANDDTQARSQ